MVFNNYNAVDLRSGILTANGGYTSSSGALLNCTLGGLEVGVDYTRLQVAGAVALNGALGIELANGFVPATNDRFTVVTAGTRSGAFTSFHYPSNELTLQLSNSANSVILRVSEVLTVQRPILLPPQVSGTNLLLSWTAVSNTTYRLEFNPDLAPSSWSALPGDVTGQSNLASKLEPISLSRRFYRVRVLPLSGPASWKKKKFAAPFS